MSLNFFKNFAKVKGEQLEEGMVNLAVALDKEGAAEAAIKQKQDEHSKRIEMLQEANASYRKEHDEYIAEKNFYDRLMNEAEAVQTLITEGQGDQAQLNADLEKLVAKIEQRAPILEKEKQEAEEAEQWMKEMQEAVEEISKELVNLRDVVNQAKQDIQRAELDKERQRKKAEQAEVLVGLRKAGNKYDVALNALQNKAKQEQAEAEKFKIKADSLKKEKSEDVSEILGKYSNASVSTSTESLSDRLAKLKK
jgi:hypothetical protein